MNPRDRQFLKPSFPTQINSFHFFGRPSFSGCSCYPYIFILPVGTVD